MSIISDLIVPVANTYLNARYGQPQTPSIRPADNPYIPNVIEGLYNPQVNAPAGPSTGSRYYTYDSKTGTFRPRRRRRRRALLTCGDKEDLMFAQGLKANDATKQLLAKCGR